MFRFGPDTGPVAVVAMPLFEEANRLRAFAVTLCRALAKRGVASVLADLPGQGESLATPGTLTLVDVQDAFVDAIESLRETGHLFSVGLRSGAMLDRLSVLDGRWYFAPQSGADLLKALTRIKQMAVGPSVRLGDLWFFDDIDRAPDVPEPPVEIAGNIVSTAMLTGLEMDVRSTREYGPGPLRILRLDLDPKTADRHVPGTPLWRRAEPGNDAALAALLADDIAEWIAACEG